MLSLQIRKEISVLRSTKYMSPKCGLNVRMSVYKYNEQCFTVLTWLLGFTSCLCPQFPP